MDIRVIGGKEVDEDTRWEVGLYAVRMSAWLWVTAGIVIPLVTMVGGLERWASPVYTFLLLVPGAPHVWALLLLIAALVVAWGLWTGHLRTCQYGLRAIATWLVFFGVGVIMAAIALPNVAFTVGIWFGFMAMHVFILAAVINYFPEIVVYGHEELYEQLEAKNEAE